MAVARGTIEMRIGPVLAGFPERLPLPAGGAEGAANLQAAVAEKAGAKAVQGGAPNPAEVERVTESLNRMLQAFNTSLRFTIHEETGEIMVRVIETDTGEVIREIPPKQVLDAYALMARALGLLLDQRA